LGFKKNHLPESSSSTFDLFVWFFSQNAGAVII